MRVSSEKGIDHNLALDAFLDYLIDTFNVENLFRFNMDLEKVFIDARDREPLMFCLLVDWFSSVTEEMTKGKGFLDFFGGIYEEWFKSKHAASNLGQFYTPEQICSLMSKMTVRSETKLFNDCACGSGRTMLAAYANCDKTKFNYFEAGDIDYTSCKMCALNFMIHGMIGKVKRQDALLYDTPRIIYHINEVRWPVPSNLYSIRIEYPEIPEEEKPKEEPKPELKHAPVQLELDFGW